MQIDSIFIEHDIEFTAQSTNMRPTPVLQRAIRRLRLTTKQAGKDYYKGTGTGSMGRHTKHGGYIVDYNKVRTYVCPDLKDFEVWQLPDAVLLPFHD